MFVTNKINFIDNKKGLGHNNLSLGIVIVWIYRLKQAVALGNGRANTRRYAFGRVTPVCP